MIGFDKNRSITLLFSAKAAEQGGWGSCEVPDGNGGSKRVDYTAILGNDISGYIWADKQVAYSGPAGSVGNYDFSMLRR